MVDQDCRPEGLPINENGLLSHTIHKNQFQADQEVKLEKQNFEAFFLQNNK